MPVEREPNHRTVFQNDYVQVFRVKLAPGKSTLMHTHTRDDAAVRLSTATTTSESLGEPPGPATTAQPGSVSARNNAKVPTTHRVHNVGTTLFDVLDVQILQRPDGADAPPLGPIAAENPQMRVYRYQLEPGGQASRHSHARPFLLVAATDLTFRSKGPNGGLRLLRMKTGDVQWVDAAATHAFVNGGKAAGILVEIELK